MFPAQNGCCIPLQRCRNYQCWAIPTYILDILVRENTLWAGVIPSPLTEEHLTLQMRNPSDVSKIFFSFFFFLKYCPARNGSKPASCQLAKPSAGPHPQVEEPAALALTSVELCYIKTGVNIHTVFFSLSHSCLNVGRIKGVGCWMRQSADIKEEYQNVFSSFLTGLQILMLF